MAVQIGCIDSQDSIVQAPASNLALRKRIQTEVAMKLSNFVNVGFAIVVMIRICSCPAIAQIKPSSLAGEWSGSGTERESLFGPMQKTSCRSKIRSEVNRMNNEMVCSAQSGVRRTMQFQITLNGNQITGDFISTTATQPPEVKKGSVSGYSAGESADMQFNFSAMMPSAAFKLVVLNPSSYSIRMTAMGTSVMDVTFKKIGQPGRTSQVEQ
jgi:hypothetical protein